LSDGCPFPLTNRRQSSSKTRLHYRYLEPIPSPLEFMAAGCGQVRKKTWKANLPSMSQIRVL